MIEQIQARLKEELPKYANPEKLAEGLGLRPEAVRRVLDGGGLRGKNYKLFLKALGLEIPTEAPLDYWAGVRAAVTRVESALEQLRQEMDAASAQQNVTPANNKADPEGRPITSLDDTQEILKLQGKPATPPPTEKQEKQGGA